MNTREEFYKIFPAYTWNFNKEILEERFGNLIERCNNTIDSILKLEETSICFKNVCEVLADLDCEITFETKLYTIYAQASPIEEIRNKANEMNKRLSNFIIDLEMRKDIYDLIIKVYQQNEPLSYESQRYIDKLILNKKRNGLHLSDTDRNKIMKLNKEISELCLDFSQNVSAEDTSLRFNKKQLEGMSDDFLRSLKQDSNEYIITLKLPYVNPILKQCKVIETRRIVEKAFNSRCIDKNTKILEKLVELRDEKAKILGYKTHADFVSEILMSKTADKVKEFLESLFDMVKSSHEKEMDRLLELKKEEYIERDLDFDGIIYPYDLLYYQNMVSEKDYKIAGDIIKQYFPLDYVTEKMLEFYQNLLSLKFEKIEGAKVIFDDVSLYAVFDGESRALVGYFYLDLFPRDGKFTHAMCLGMQSACIFKGKMQIGCATMFANFTKPLPDKPSLLTHYEVETYFHEFGHVMHHICSKTHYSIFHGMNVERDFVEAPSQMLQNWCWEKASLKMMTSHFKCNEYYY